MSTTTNPLDDSGCGSGAAKLKHFSESDIARVKKINLERLPLPLAVTLERFVRHLEEQEPVASVWTLRDCLECALKFTACTALADFLQNSPPETQRTLLLSTLFRKEGLSIGNWRQLLRDTVSTKRPRKGESLQEPNHRIVPQIGDLIPGKNIAPKTDAKFSDPLDQIVAWRNKVVGHGVFQVKRENYGVEVLNWLPFVAEWYRALAGLFDNYELVSEAVGGSQTDLVWMGINPGHLTEVVVAGSYLRPMLLRRKSPAATLSYGPLLSAQAYMDSGKAGSFFIDKHVEQKSRTVFLDYFSGRTQTQSTDWSELKELRAKLPPEYDWERTPVDRDEIPARLQRLFRGFEDEYLPPDHLLSPLWSFVEESTKGYFHLIAPGGTGKSYFAKGVGVDAASKDIPALIYPITKGVLAESNTFVFQINELTRQLEHPRPSHLINEIQQYVSRVEELPKQLVSYLGDFMRFNHYQQLLLVIDGMDEITDRKPGGSIITDFLPLPTDLPEGCFIVLTSRETLCRDAGEKLKMLLEKPGNPPLWKPFRLHPSDEGNQALVESYFVKYLPEELRGDPAVVRQLAARADHRLLYARHFCEVLKASAYAGPADIPEHARFYDDYLRRLRAQTGEHRYTALYETLLLTLCAAQAPVTLHQLQYWGEPGFKEEDIAHALAELSHFLHVEKEPYEYHGVGRTSEPRYKLAHEDFRKYAATSHLQEKLTLRHKHIAEKETALGWKKRDPQEFEDWYDLRYFAIHAFEVPFAYLEAIDEQVAALGKRFYVQATTVLLDGSIMLREALWRTLEPEGRWTPEFQNNLAGAYANRGIAKCKSNHFEDAVVDFDQAISLLEALWRSLEPEGRWTPELHDCLALAYSNRGIAKRDHDRLIEAVSDLDEAVSLYEALRRTIEPHGLWNLKFQDDFAKAYSNRGAAKSAQGRTDEAIADYDLSVILHESLRRTSPEGSWTPEFQNDFALVYSNRGGAKATQGRSLEATADFDQAISLREALRRTLEPEGAWAPEFQNELAESYYNRGNTNRPQGRLAEAIADFDQAICLREALRRTLEPEGRWTPGFQNDLAAVYFNRGPAKSEHGRVNEAIADFDQTISLREALRLTLEPEGRWTPMFQNNLAAAYSNRGGSKASQDRLAEATADLDQAISLREALRSSLEPDARWTSEFQNDLALAYFNRGTAKSSHGRLNQGVVDLDQAISLREALRLTLDPLGRRTPEFQNDLALAYFNRAVAKSNQGRLADAIADLDQTISLREALRLILEPERRWTSKFQNDLALAYFNRAAAKSNQGRLADAIADFDQAISLREALRLTLEPESRWTAEFQIDLASAYYKRGVAKSKQGRSAEAVSDYDQSIAVCEALRRSLEPEGRWQEYHNQLFAAYYTRGTAKHTQGRLEEAIADFDQAISLSEALRRSLVPVGNWSPEFQYELADAYASRGAAKTKDSDFGEAVADFDQAISLLEAFWRPLEPEHSWTAGFHQKLATAYFNRGVAKGDQGRFADAVADYDGSIALRESLRRSLESKGSWTSAFLSELADAYFNRGNMNRLRGRSAEAIADYDQAIYQREFLRHTLESQGCWTPEFQTDLAWAYVNRGRAELDNNRLYQATADLDQTISLREALRLSLEPNGNWSPEFHCELAGTYASRGIAKFRNNYFEDAVADFDKAISMREVLRRTIAPDGRWTAKCQSDLARAYSDRGAAKGNQGRLAEAVIDYDLSIALREALRHSLEPEGNWTPEFQNELAEAYYARGTANGPQGRFAEAIADFDEAISLREALWLSLKPEDRGNVQLHNVFLVTRLRRANLLWNAGRMNEAIQDYDWVRLYLAGYSRRNPTINEFVGRLYSELKAMSVAALEIWAHKAIGAMVSSTNRSEEIAAFNQLSPCFIDCTFTRLSAELQEQLMDAGNHMAKRYGDPSSTLGPAESAQDD